MSEEQLTSFDPARQSKSDKCKKFVNKRVPITAWLPHYTLAKFLQDVLAGLSVGLTEVPQGIAYAVVAGLEPQYGLYSGFMGCFVYAILGSCKDVNIGPTAIMAVMVHPYVEKYGPGASILFSFLTGCIVFALGVLNLGFLVQFFSYPVIAGFTSAASLQIASTQLAPILGIKKKSDTFIQAWEAVVGNIEQTRTWDAVLGFTCLLILIAMKELNRFGSVKYNSSWSKGRNFVGRFSWLLSLARNALVVIAATIIAYLFQDAGEEPFTLTGKLEEGLPPFRVPDFSLTNNGTTTAFGDVIANFGGSLAFLPLVCILESVAIAKAFSQGKTVDATQEMLAVGVSNFLGSFFGAMPVTGSFTRSAVNNASGVQTTMGGVITGVIVVFALAFLTAYFYYIPKATLAAVIICAMINLFDYKAIIVLWRTKKIDLVPFFVTLVASLVINLEYGILIGIATNLVFILYTSMKPKVAVERRKFPEGDVYVVTPSRSLQFPSAEYVRETIMERCYDDNLTIIIDGKYVGSIDATVARNFSTLVNDLKRRSQPVIFWNFKETVKQICTGLNADMYQYFRDGLIEDVIDNPALNRINPDVVYAIA